MKNLVKVEELFVVVLCIYLFSRLDYAWWWFAVLFLTPDLGMIGYAANPRLGAIIYNVVHHKGVGVSLYLFGVLAGSQLLALIGLIVVAHSSFDRAWGYGLKHFDAFTHTHLGWIGPDAGKNL